MLVSNIYCYNQENEKSKLQAREKGTRLASMTLMGKSYIEEKYMEEEWIPMKAST